MIRNKKFKGEHEYTDFELFPNEEDKVKMLSMTELERERIINERIQKLNLEKERAELIKQKSTDNERRRDVLMDMKNRRSKRKEKDEERASGKHEEPSDAHNKESIDNLSSFSGESSSESGEVASSESDDDDEYMGSISSKSRSSNHSKSNKNRKRSRSSSYESILSMESDDGKKKKAPMFTISVNDIEKIRVKRLFIEKYWEVPIFDARIKECFVKINIEAGKSTSNTNSSNTGYLLGQIKDVIENKDKRYSFLNKQCSKYILVAHANHDKIFSLNVISNSPLLDVEFRVWKDRMEKYNIPLPTAEKIKSITENIEKIKCYKFSDDELAQMINRKIDIKIQNQDKNINITYELAVLTEEFNAAKQKFEETKDPKYSEVIEKLTPKLQSLLKMQEDREKEDNLKAEKDRITQINRKNLEKQKINDMKFSQIHRKRNREVEDVYNPYKRRDCKPMNLFDSGYLKKESVKNEEKPTSRPDDAPQGGSSNTSGLNNSITNDVCENSSVSRFQVMKNLEQKIKSFSPDIDELMKLKKEREQKLKGGSKEQRFLFSVLGIGQVQLIQMINNQNAKLLKEGNARMITIDQIEY